MKILINQFFFFSSNNQYRPRNGSFIDLTGQSTGTSVGSKESDYGINFVPTEEPKVIDPKEQALELQNKIQEILARNPFMNQKYLLEVLFSPKQNNLYQFFSFSTTYNFNLFEEIKKKVTAKIEQEFSLDDELILINSERKNDIEIENEIENEILKILQKLFEMLDNYEKKGLNFIKNLLSPVILNRIYEDFHPLRNLNLLINHKNDNEKRGYYCSFNFLFVQESTFEKFLEKFIGEIRKENIIFDLIFSNEINNEKRISYKEQIDKSFAMSIYFMFLKIFYFSDFEDKYRRFSLFLNAIVEQKFKNKVLNVNFLNRFEEFYNVHLESFLLAESTEEKSSKEENVSSQVNEAVKQNSSSEDNKVFLHQNYFEQEALLKTQQTLRDSFVDFFLFFLLKEEDLFNFKELRQFSNLDPTNINEFVSKLNIEVIEQIKEIRSFLFSEQIEIDQKEPNKKSSEQKKSIAEKIYDMICAKDKEQKTIFFNQIINDLFNQMSINIRNMNYKIIPDNKVFFTQQLFKNFSNQNKKSFFNNVLNMIWFYVVNPDGIIDLKKDNIKNTDNIKFFFYNILPIMPKMYLFKIQKSLLGVLDYDLKCYSNDFRKEKEINPRVLNKKNLIEKYFDNLTELLNTKYIDTLSLVYFLLSNEESHEKKSLSSLFQEKITQMSEVLRENFVLEKFNNFRNILVSYDVTDVKFFLNNKTIDAFKDDLFVISNYLTHVNSIKECLFGEPDKIPNNIIQSIDKDYLVKFLDFLIQKEKEGFVVSVQQIFENTTKQNIINTLNDSNLSIVRGLYKEMPEKLVNEINKLFVRMGDKDLNEILDKINLSKLLHFSLDFFIKPEAENIFIKQLANFLCVSDTKKKFDIHFYKNKISIILLKIKIFLSEQSTALTTDQISFRKEQVVQPEGSKEKAQEDQTSFKEEKFKKRENSESMFKITPSILQVIVLRNDLKDIRDNYIDVLNIIKNFSKGNGSFLESKFLDLFLRTPRKAALELFISEYEDFLNKFNFETHFPELLIKAFFNAKKKENRICFDLAKSEDGFEEFSKTFLQFKNKNISIGSPPTSEVQEKYDFCSFVNDSLKDFFYEYLTEFLNSKKDSHIAISFILQEIEKNKNNVFSFITDSLNLFSKFDEFFENYAENYQLISVLKSVLLLEENNRQGIDIKINYYDQKISEHFLNHEEEISAREAFIKKGNQDQISKKIYYDSEIIKKFLKNIRFIDLLDDIFTNFKEKISDKDMEIIKDFFRNISHTVFSKSLYSCTVFMQFCIKEDAPTTKFFSFVNFVRNLDKLSLNEFVEKLNIFSYISGLKEQPSIDLLEKKLAIYIKDIEFKKNNLNLIASNIILCLKEFYFSISDKNYFTYEFCFHNVFQRIKNDIYKLFDISIEENKIPDFPFDSDLFSFSSQTMNEIFEEFLRFWQKQKTLHEMRYGTRLLKEALTEKQKEYQEKLQIVKATFELNQQELEKLKEEELLLKKQLEELETDYLKKNSEKGSKIKTK